MPRRMELIQSFRAYDDLERPYTLQVWMGVLDSSTTVDPHAEQQGERSFTTEDGKRVIRWRKGVYELLNPFGRNVALHSDEPGAP